MVYGVLRWSLWEWVRFDIIVGNTTRERPQNRRQFEIAKIRQEDIDAYVDNAPLKIEPLPQKWNIIREEARKNGIRRYGPEFRMSHNAIVAYVRHHKTNYEYLLRDIECIPGGRALYYEPLKERVDTMVRSALQEQYGSLTAAS